MTDLKNQLRSGAGRPSELKSKAVEMDRALPPGQQGGSVCWAGQHMRLSVFPGF